MVFSKKSKKNNNKKKLNIKKVLTIISFLILLVGFSGVGMIVYAARDLPAWDPEQLSGANATLLYDDTDHLFHRLHAEENRTEISYDKIPTDLINAFISTEDKSYYDHHGVNFKGIARAMFINITSGNLTSQGASTITQQLAKNAFLSFDKNWERKVKEIILSFKLESTYSKDEIMNLYLNKIYFGAGAYGVQAAANTYYGKDTSSLTLAESAMLAGLPQGPNFYNPFQYLDRAKTRQKIVLNNMVDCDFISEAQAKEAYDVELKFVSNPNQHLKYGYFIDAVVEEALDILDKTKTYEDPDSAVYRSGLKIYTTMNTGLQSHAEKLFNNPDNLPKQKSKDGKNVQAALTLIEHHNGEVKALMGGREYEQQRGFNRATSAYRQPGSSIKPLTVYAPALEQGKMPFTVYDDSPLSYKIGNGIWRPHNYNGKYRGLITMRTAVQWSINTYAVQLLDSIGLRSSFDFGKSLGLPLIDSPGNNDLGLAALSLGGLTKGVTPLQMAAAYGSFGNKGIYVEPHLIRKITDARGSIIYEYKPISRQVMSEETAWLMTSMMQTVVNSGTGTKARIPNIMVAGKTGTSEEYRDAWFCGLTPAYSAAVWMGFDNDYTMRNYPRDYPGETAYGGNFPARLFQSMMKKAHENAPQYTWTKPASIIKVDVCSKSGKIPGKACPAEQLISEYSVKQYVPTEKCDVHELVTICKESGKIATKYCPETETVSRVRVGPNSSEPDKIPSEECDIHTEFDISNMFKHIINERFGPEEQDLQEDNLIPDTYEETRTEIIQDNDNREKLKKSKEVINNIFNED